MFPELTFFSVMGGHPCQRIRRLGNLPRTMTIGFTGFCRNSQRLSRGTRLQKAWTGRRHTKRRGGGKSRPSLVPASGRPNVRQCTFSVEQREGRRDRGAVVESLEHVGPIHAPRCGAFLSLNEAQEGDGP